MPDTGGNIFPYSIHEMRQGVGQYERHITGFTGGLTLRDLYAGMAMQGMISNGNTNDLTNTAYLTATCYEIADAMIKQRTESERANNAAATEGSEE